MAIKYTGGFKTFTFKQLNSGGGEPPAHTFVWLTPAGEIFSGNEGATVNASVQAADSLNLSIIYSLANATTLPSGVILGTDGVLSGTLPSINANIDYNFDIMATNGSDAIYRSFSIHSNNVAASPVWTTPTGSVYSGNENTAVTANVVATVTSGLPITYSLTNGTSLPGGVVFSNAGSISGVLPVVNSTTVYNFTARAETTEGFTDRDFSITSVNVPVTPVWSTPSGQLYSGNENTGFSANVVATVTNGLPITYSLTNATTLPGGVTLSNAGQVSGTLPSVSNTTVYNFTVRAATAEANADRDFSIQSVYVPVIPVWTTPAGSFYSDNENVAFSKNLVATVSDGSTITYALANATTLPSGVSLLSNGLVYGALPDVVNTTVYNFDISATAAEGSVNRSFSITSVNVVTDPSYNSIWVMSHFDGVANSNTFVDNGPLAQVLAGNPTTGPFLSNTTAKFGGTSVYFPSNDAVLPIAFDAGTDFTLGAFTIETWFNCDSGFTTNRSLLTRPQNNPTNNTHVFNLTTHSDGRLRFYWNTASMTGTTIIQPNTWYHVAITRNGANVAMFVNGVQEITGSTFALTGNNQQFFIGGNNAVARFRGYIDDFRITKAVRYTGNFTAPVAPFPNS